MASSFAASGVSWFEGPVSSADLQGLLLMLAARKAVGEGKSGDLGGARLINKKQAAT